MPVDWTPHRFSGGALALDVANTVVLRGDAERRLDRFEDPSEIGRFAAAVCEARPDEFDGTALDVGGCAQVAPLVIKLREAIDRLFRNAAQEGRVRAGDLAALMQAGTSAMMSVSPDDVVWRFGRTIEAKPLPARIAFGHALTVSALGLLPVVAEGRIHVCNHCGWLFVDRSRNGSRRWCDMAVCGNRIKARRHYRRARDVWEASS